MLTVAGILVVTVLGASPTVARDPVAQIASEQDLATAVAGLDDPTEKPAALCRLVRFAGFFLYEGSVSICSENQKLDGLRRKAATTLRAHRDPATATIALASDDRDVRFWGVMAVWPFRGERERWAHLLPQLQRIATQDDENLRAQAVWRLQWFPEAREFLEQLRASESEDSPTVWLQLDFQSHLPETHERFCQRTVRFLSSANPTVRLSWLAFIADNPRRAPVLQVGFSSAVVNRVAELALSKDVQERQAAARAMAAIAPVRDPTTSAEPAR